MSDADNRLPLDGLVPAWAHRISKLRGVDGDAWDERVRRIAECVATDEDREVQAAAEAALRDGRPLPPEARRMPSQPAIPRRRSAWRPAEFDTVERAIAVGIPPLIAERIVAGDVTETRSVKACRHVGRSFQILVLIGERGCGKSYAAADWLWSSNITAPAPLARKVSPRRFLEAPTLSEIPFENRPALGMAALLAVDDVGTEKDFLVPDLAGIFVTRYRNALPTVITTNLNRAEFSERYGMRFADRMREAGRFLVVSNSPEDSLRGRTP